MQIGIKFEAKLGLLGWAAGHEEEESLKLKCKHDIFQLSRTSEGEFLIPPGRFFPQLPEDMIFEDSEVPDHQESGTTASMPHRKNHATSGGGGWQLLRLRIS